MTKITFNLLIILFIQHLFVGCNNSKKGNQIDSETYFLELNNQFPSKNLLLVDSFSETQRKIIKEKKLKIYIPKGYKSYADQNDKESFILYNNDDSILIVAKSFKLSDSIYFQIRKSEKIQLNPDDNFNDLSEFNHFKKCERTITNDTIGAMLFGGTFFDILGADYSLHQTFNPKNQLFKHGEIVVLLKDTTYLIIARFDNGFSEDLNDRPSSLAIGFRTPLNPDDIYKPYTGVPPNVSDKGFSDYPRFLVDINDDGYLDFGRFVGNSEIFLSFQFGLENGEFSKNSYCYNSYKKMDVGYRDKDIWLQDVDNDGYLDYCGYFGNKPNVFKAALLGSPTGFDGEHYHKL